jgi:DNA modification methylase
MTEIDVEYYPISLEKVKESVARKNGRNNRKKPDLKQTLLNKNRKYFNVKKLINEFGEEIVRVDGDIPVDLSVADGERFLFISYDQTILTHGLHKYPAKFFPELPRWLIRRYSRNYDTILDPFSGSGTTNVEALLSKRHSVGVDVDPFSRVLSRVKTTPLDKEELEWALEELLRTITDFCPSAVSNKDIPDFPYRDNWFNKEIVLELAYIRKSIDEVSISCSSKDFFRICFSSIIRSVSNADDNCTRTVIRKKLNKSVYPSDALTKFAESILINVSKMKEFSEKCPQDIRADFPDDCDARDIKYPRNFFDLALTSPPYVNAVDYPRTHQLEIYWLGFATGSLTPLKRKHIGTESVKAKDYRFLHSTGIPEADEVISRIYTKDPRRAYIACKYLEDMKRNLKEVYRVLKRGRKYVIVVGNNKIRGEIFKNWSYIMRIAKEEGFEVESYFASEVIRHFIKIPREERIDTDWILILRKEGR